MPGKRRRLLAVLRLGMLVALASLGPGEAAAHHGWSGYDNSQVLNLVGVIREAGYEHPHAHIRLEVSEKIWLVVLAPPSRLERRGLPATMLKVGEAATVVGYPHRSDPTEMRAERITVDGKTVELR